MRHGRNALRLEICDRLHDLIAEVDAADALVALLNARGLAVNLDLEPDAADACGLHREVASFSGYARIGLVAADHGIQRAMAADFLVDDHVDVDIALGL